MYEIPHLRSFPNGIFLIILFICIKNNDLALRRRKAGCKVEKEDTERFCWRTQKIDLCEIAGILTEDWEYNISKKSYLE